VKAGKEKYSTRPKTKSHYTKVKLIKSTKFFHNCFQMNDIQPFFKKNDEKCGFSHIFFAFPIIKKFVFLVNY